MSQSFEVLDEEETLLYFSDQLEMWGFLPPWRFEKTVFHKLPKKIYGPKRAKFQSNIKKHFIDQARELLGPSCTKAQGESILSWEIHHIVPLAYGGENAFSNFAFVPAVPHRQIHNFIDYQTGSMKMGEKKEVWIPRQDGFVWAANAPQGHPLPNKRKIRKKRRDPTRLPDEVFLLANQKTEALLTAFLEGKTACDLPLTDKALLPGRPHETLALMLTKLPKPSAVAPA